MYGLQTNGSRAPNRPSERSAIRAEPNAPAAAVQDANTFQFLTDRRLPTGKDPLLKTFGQMYAKPGRKLPTMDLVAQGWETTTRGVEALGADVVAEIRFGDHHRYRPGDLADLAAQAPVWITTEKDAIKIPAAWAGAADVRVLAIELAVDEPDRLLGWLDARLR